MNIHAPRSSGDPSARESDLHPDSVQRFGLLRDAHSSMQTSRFIFHSLFCYDFYIIPSVSFEFNTCVLSKRIFYVSKRNGSLL